MKQKSSIILTCIGAAGVIATAIVAVRATPKATAAINNAEAEKGEELTKQEIVKITAPIYAPTAILALSTIACIFGANVMNKRGQATVASAYALLNQSYKEYRKKARDIYGEESDASIREEMVKEQYDKQYDDIKEMIDDEEEVLFWDFNTLDFFNAPMKDVLQKVTFEDGMECWFINTPLVENMVDYTKF